MMKTDINKARESAKRNIKRIQKDMPSALDDKIRDFPDRLRRLIIPPDSGLGVLYGLMDELNQFVSRYTPCKRGCDACCHIAVDVSSLEAEYITLRTGIAHRVHPVSSASIDTPCPFLKDHHCSIYQYRPYACRRHQALFNPKWYPVESCNDLCASQVRVTELEDSYAHLIRISNATVYDIRSLFSLSAVNGFNG